MSSIINISIDCSQIDKSKLAQGKYLNITVSKRREVDNYGNTHTLTYNQSKEEKAANIQKIYLKGSAKEFVFEDRNNQQSNFGKAHIDKAIPNQQPMDEDDLPF